jgi:dihydrofolate reductase
MIVTALSTSLDGFIAGADDGPGRPLGAGGERLFDWLTDGDTPSRHYPEFRMAPASAEFFDEGADGVGAVISGRRTYDISNAWGGRGPLPGVPLFVMTHRAPDDVPAADPSYTFVLDGIASAVEQARAVAGDRNVALMGSRAVQQAINAGLLDQLTVHLVPLVLGGGVRLLGEIDPGAVELALVEVLDAPGVTHLSYRVVK